MNGDSIVTYRSEMERAADQYYWDALTNSDPAVVLIVFKVAGVLALAVTLFCIYKNFKRR